MMRAERFMPAWLVLVVCGSVLANDLHVPSDYDTIQAAIDDSNDGDTVIVAPGRYVENIDYKGKAITVRSGAPSDWEVVENTIIDGSEGDGWEIGSCVVFDEGETSNSILEGFTLTRGTGTHAYYEEGRRLRKAPTAGGGILCLHSSPTIRNCNITHNGNRDWQPGEPWNPYDAEVRNGGGIALLGNCQATISSCMIVDNVAEFYGAGILISSNTPETATSKIINCTVANNESFMHTAEERYEVDCWNTKPVISSTIIWPNLDPPPEDDGYGSSNYNRSLLIADASLVTYSCVKDAYILLDDDSIHPDVGYWGAEPCDLTLAGGNIAEGPIFVQPFGVWEDAWDSNYIFPDYHLVGHSTCINAGDPNFAPAPGETDVDGQARVMGGRVDIGADEVVPEIAVIGPTAGDIWTAGSLHVVEWSSYGAGAVDILLSVDGGDSWKTVGSGVVDHGIYLWDISASINSDQCVISVVPNPADANVVTVDSGVFSVWPYHGPASLPRRHGWRADAGERYGPESGCVKWKFETAGPVTAAVTVGREIKKTTKAYIACEDGRLYALDAATGTLMWSYDVNSPLSASAAEARDGTVYVGSEGGKLYAIDKNGQLLWTHTTDGPIHSTPAVTPNGRIYVSSVDGLVYALARDGSDLWRFETNGFAALGGSVFVSPQEGPDGSVYIAGLYDPNLYALNGDDGSVEWVCNFEHTIQIPDEWGEEPQEVNVAGWPFASPVVAFDGTVYQGLLFDSEIYAIEPTAGGISWSTSLAGLRLRYGKAPDDVVMWYDAGEPPEYVEVDGEMRLVRSVTPIRHAYCWSTPALGPDGTIYVSFNDPYLRAVDPSGTIKWMTKLGELGGFTLTVGSNGLIYAASDDNNLYVVNTEGAEIAQFEGEGWLSHPVIGPDGTLYVSDANNAVWAISEEACDGETPVLDGAGKAKSKKPVRFKASQIRKSKAVLRVRK